MSRVRARVEQLYRELNRRKGADLGETVVEVWTGSTAPGVDAWTCPTVPDLVLSLADAQARDAELILVHLTNDERTP